MTPQQILEAAGLAVPDAPLESTALEPVGSESWRQVVDFTAEGPVIEAWIDECFPEGIASRAYKADMAEYSEYLGEGVQKQGDRVAAGTHDGVAFVVVVGQEASPAVHVGASAP